MAPLRAKITELIPMPMGPARSGSRECINSFGKKVGSEIDCLRSSSLIPALKPFRSRLAEVANKEYRTSRLKAKVIFRLLIGGIMSTATTASSIPREPELLGQTVVVIGGSAGIGLETARRARAEGANLILTGRNPERLQRAASELDALSTAAFDATDPAPLERFFRDLPTTIDHVMVTAGRPYYGRLVDMDFAEARRA